MKAIALRLDDGLHAQLQVIAQLQGVTLTELIRTAVETYLDQARQAPELAAKAQGVLDAIEAEAASRRDAIATLFTPPTPEAPDAPVTPITDGKPSGRSRKPPSAALMAGYA
jgi:predicted transcriptional regulator